ncbi:hypothetical protein Scep_001859 [Stephania cephalantha]|uniref:Uncharacterized protein n=1 Tax=Stephania cephalantha TaxID=152367 RepID=A0AAP0LA60_9MAGN
MVSLNDFQAGVYEGVVHLEELNILLSRRVSLYQARGSISFAEWKCNGSETELLDSVSDPLLIKDGSEMEYNNSISDPLLIRDGSETESNNSVSDPLLIRYGSETEYNYNCTLSKNLHLCSVSVPFLNSVYNPSLIRNGNTFSLLIESATTILETE